jgi:hypothetical protein
VAFLQNLPGADGMRWAEIGHHHHLAGPYLIRFAQEASWREDHRRDPNGVQVDRVVALAMRNKPSVGSGPGASLFKNWRAPSVTKNIIAVV